MNKLLERVRYSLKSKLWYLGQHGRPNKFTQADITDLASTAITAICDEIDEGGFESAAKMYWEKRNSKADFTDMLTSVINSYLSHLKSTTETKE